MRSHLASTQKYYSGKKLIYIYWSDLLPPNDHICLLLMEAQKRPCSLIISSVSPLFFSKETGIILRAGDSILSLSKHFLLSKDLCGLCWVDVGFHYWIHSSGQILPSAVRVQLQEQSWARWVCAYFRVKFGLYFLPKTFLKMHWGCLKSNRQFFLKRASQVRFDQNGSFFSQIEFCVGSERGRASERGLTVSWILAVVKSFSCFMD